MKLHYVKSSNHQKFVSAVAKVQNGTAREAKTILITGEPGVGKSRCMDNFGADTYALYIEGMPEMSLPYVKELIAFELGCDGIRSSFKTQQAVNAEMCRRKLPIILDEAQHGLHKKAVVIEYLRRLCEQAGAMLILVCHTTERKRFTEDKLAHIATRIGAVAEFKPANLDDTRQYLTELCEVEIDEGIVKQALEDSRGRYRLLTSACYTLELLAKQSGKTSLTFEDTRKITLCEDVMALRKGGR